MNLEANLKTVIVDESPVRAAILEEALREAGHKHVICIEEICIEETADLLARI